MKPNVYLQGLGELCVVYDCDDDNFDIHAVYSCNRVRPVDITAWLSDEGMEAIQDAIVADQQAAKQDAEAIAYKERGL